MMKIIGLRRWLAIGILVLLTSVVSLAKPKDNGKKGCGPHDNNCTSVPDGGSAAAYLLIAGTGGLGGLALRTRIKKTRLS